MNIKGIGTLKFTTVSQALAALGLIVIIGSAPARAVISDGSKEKSEAKPPAAGNDSVAHGKTDESPEAIRANIRKKLIGLVADSALEIPPANMSPDSRTREELIEEMERAEKRANDVAVIIRGSLELLTRLEHHFHVELPDYELQGVTDFRTLAGKIRARL